MSVPSDQQVARAVGEIVREELIVRREVNLPGWGSFTIEHKSGQTEMSDGKMTVHPPVDRISFAHERS